MSDKELFAPFNTDIDLIWGIMKDPDNHIIRRASDLRGYYSDAAALEDMIREGDPILYEVFEKKIPQAHGHLQSCKNRATKHRGTFNMTLRVRMIR